LSARLLFDQNLSHRLCRLLADIFPDSAPLKRLGLDRAGDDEIWKFALREGFTVVTLDADFPDMAALRGVPPKVVWLRCGNQPTAVVERIIRVHAELIGLFLEDGTRPALSSIEPVRQPLTPSPNPSLSFSHGQAVFSAASGGFCE
jgi:predicted nuclease of predicted toxin-antitoxin system